MVDVLRLECGGCVENMVDVLNMVGVLNMVDVLNMVGVFMWWVY